MIELSHISKTIKKRKILDDISCCFPDNGLFIIKGENGCGKSTLFNLLSLADKDYQGEYLFDGKDIRSLSSKEISEIRFNDISYATQKNNFLSYLDLEQNRNLNRYLLGNHESIPKGKKITETSEGESLLAIIDRALCPGKRLYLLDEVLDHLDLNNRKKTIKQILELAKTSLVIVISHDSLLLETKGTIINMEKGRFLSSDTDDYPVKEHQTTNHQSVHYSFRLMLQSFKQNILFSCLYFLLIILGFATCLMPVEMISYDYGNILKDDVNIGDNIKFFNAHTELDSSFTGTKFNSLGCLIFSDDIPNDGKVHLLSDTKKTDLTKYYTLGRNYQFDYVFDDTLPFDGCFMNYQSFTDKVSTQSDDFISLNHSSYVNKNYQTDDLNNSIRYFGDTALYEKKYGLQLNITLDDQTLYVFSGSDIPNAVYPFTDFESPDFINLGDLFGSTMNVHFLPSLEYSSRSTIDSYMQVLISDTNYQKLSLKAREFNSMVYQIDENNQQATCSAIASKSLIPSFYGNNNGISNKVFKSNYVNLINSLDYERKEGIIIVVLSVFFSSFVALIYARIELYYRKNEIAILYQSGYQKKQTFLNLFFRQGIPLLLASFLGYFLSGLFWGIADQNMFRYVPFPTWLCFLVALLIIIIQIGVLLLAFAESEKNRW